MRNATWFSGFLLALAVSGMGSQVLAQTAPPTFIPPAIDPGAVMMREYRDITLRREFPFIYRPIVIHDVVRPVPPAEIDVMPGVIPGERSIQGSLRTPGGATIYSNPQE